MTREEFNSYRFTSNTCAIHSDGNSYPVVMVDFQEAILSLDMFYDVDNLNYVRCESIDIDE